MIYTNVGRERDLTRRRAPGGTRNSKAKPDSGLQYHILRILDRYPQAKFEVMRTLKQSQS